MSPPLCYSVSLSQPKTLGVRQLLLRSEWIRVLKRWQTALAVALIVVSLLAGYLDYQSGRYFSPMDTLSAYVAFLVAIGGGPVSLWPGVVALIGPLILGDSLAWDRRTGMIRLMVSRVGRRRYITGKLLAVNLYTAIIVLSALCVSLAVAFAWLPSQLPPWREVDGKLTIYDPRATYAVVEPFPTYLHDLFFTNPIVYLTILVLILVLPPLAWANLSLLLSIWTENIYLVLAAPWLICMALSFILGQPFIGGWHYSPLVLSGPFVQIGEPRLPDWAIPMLWCAVIAITIAGTYFGFLHTRGGDIID